MRTQVQTQTLDPIAPSSAGMSVKMPSAIFRSSPPPSSRSGPLHPTPLHSAPLRPLTSSPLLSSPLSLTLCRPLAPISRAPRLPSCSSSEGIFATQMVHELSWAISRDLSFTTSHSRFGLLLICTKQDHTVMMVKELSWVIPCDLSFYNISFPFRFIAYLVQSKIAR